MIAATSSLQLSAAIGVARADCEAASAAHPALEPLLPQLDHLQSRLLDLGSALATPISSSNAAQLERAAFDEDGAETRQLEESPPSSPLSFPPSSPLSSPPSFPPIFPTQISAHPPAGMDRLP